ncbi:MAG: CD225/dispanin family protein [Candidatus Hydrogenedentes bacterium]|nr:CD225/dispanin family protein [Candidatus Hydrogenedentota bacterium]
MYCHKCGALNEDNAWRCTRCGTVLHHDGPLLPAGSESARIATHLASAILVTIFFLPSPVGLVAIYYALTARGRIAQGNLDAARAASKRALIWCWISVAVGIAIVAYTSRYLLGYMQNFTRQFQQF